MRNLIQSLSAGIILSLVSTAAHAEGISTHVLDLKDGVGRANVPVTLSIQDDNNSWTDIGSAMTEENGRVESFGKDMAVKSGVYKLTFDMSEDGETFFPEIDVVFNVEDPEEHYHVPVIVSPFGYSTYRGN
ncbi:hydroxyisourate hydrolase [Pleurocapsa sp. CCALA 161]|uniref:hydroxyisourate hydrolase n=1 Tax=Pleurocapsa sp. CCALA 161 TaxID=2107688 RepID=UPI000D070F6E|nr:hydroxyisourate hydrolase [Pleurocapsa sp. CCALA 161]PSB06450.1 hydroxyisourate hydrolase [Pleurocapsa sp. CCALA 161]